MSLRGPELEAIAAEVTRELAGASVQKLAAPTTTRVYLELRVPGRTHVLLLCADQGHARLSAVETRPPNPPRPPGWQSVLRTHLEAARLADAEALAASNTLLLHFRDEGPTLVLELQPTPGIALISRAGKVLALSSAWREGLRVGAVFKPLPPGPKQVERPSRLEGEHVHLRLAHAAEALFGEKEKTQWLHARRAPLEAKLKRLIRTQAKVRADADRLINADQLRAEGELLSRNLGRFRRGQPTVTLTDYLPDGTVLERTITLDPKRSEREEVDWRFHQYRRLTRGAQLATARLAQLEQEAIALRAALEALTVPEELPLQSPPKSAEEPRASPIREYLGHAERRIWVGKGGAQNDHLTFHVARPHHLWLHARGVPGAHVVVPLEKGEAAPPELLIDAAHLAAHHSDAKGAPKTEVSYVAVKHVRRAKGAAPGAVTYTHEKTVLLRVEAARLARLLATERTPANAD